MSMEGLLREGAETTFFLGIRVYAYGLYITLGLALCAVVMAFHSRKAPKGTAAVMICLMIPIGLLVSRLCYALLDSYARSFPFFRVLVCLNGGGGSMMGALLGAWGGVMLAARVMKLPGKQRAAMLDAFACGALLFVAVARLGESRIDQFGISFPLIGEGPAALTVQGEYGDHIAVYRLESIWALILFLLCESTNRRSSRPGKLFSLALLLFGAGQILFESLRKDSHMTFSFVGAQHLMAVGFMGAAVVLYALRALRGGKKRGLALVALISLPVMTAALVGLEFALDRSEISRWLLYALYVLIIACPCTLALAADAGAKGSTEA